MRNIRSFLISFLVSFLLLAQAVGALEIPDNKNSPLGVNFWFFADWAMFYYPFVDFFRSSRPFWPQSGGSWEAKDVKLTLDKDGYPTSLPAGVGAATVMLWSDAEYFPVPAGDYVCLYEGEGDIEFGYNAQVVTKTPGRIVVRVAAKKQGVLLKIARTDPQNHVRNIRFIMPGFEDTWQTQRFHPEFLRRLKPFRALRFMDWMATNASDNDTWENRITRASQTYATTRGAALEDMIALCNELEADPWLNLPHGADDTFIRNFVTMVKDSLKPHLKAYYEFSNEVWLFPKAQIWANNYGQQLGGGTGWGATIHGWSTRAVEMMKIVASVYGDEMPARAVRVLGTQIENTGVVNGLLSVGDAPKHFDAIAVAPYFDNGKAKGSVEEVVAAVTKSALLVGQQIQADLWIARQHNMRLISYEGGLDIWSVNATGATWGPAARFDPRMNAIYKSYLESWKAGGGELFMQYSFCNPAWGLLRSQEQDVDQAPMYVAACEFIRENRRWWDEERLEPDVNISAGVRSAVPAKISITVNQHREGGSGLVTITGGRPTNVRLYNLGGRMLGALRPVGSASGAVSYWTLPLDAAAWGPCLITGKTKNGDFQQVLFLGK